MNNKKARKLNSSFLFVLPYASIFLTFVVALIMISAVLSLTYFDTVNFPRFIGFKNYINLFTQDSDFVQYALPNTVKYALIIGPFGYLLSFFLAWILAQLPHRLRTVLAIIIYSPALTGGTLINVGWKVLFSGDNRGYLNYLLLKWGVINESIQFLQDSAIIFGIMIFVGLWSSMGLGFLAMLSGILNIDRTVYEAAYVDGMKNRFQEIFYITIPSMKPQMLFGAVMAVVGTFNASGLASAITGAYPPPQYAGWLIVDHMNDYAFSKMEMGYASALSVVLLLMCLVISRFCYRLFGTKEGE
ncbi:MAG: sugar ABC transporter permease [Bacilli bacterium]|nr:sugar ABC transporter permease [Bacilli bacterium]